MALTKKEANRLEKTKSYARPVFMYVATGCIGLLVATICYLLVRELTTMSEVSALLMAIFAGLIAPITAHITGRSYEKAKAAANYPADQIVEDPVPPDRPDYDLDGEPLD